MECRQMDHVIHTEPRGCGGEGDYVESPSSLEGEVEEEEKHFLEDQEESSSIDIMNDKAPLLSSSASQSMSAESWRRLSSALFYGISSFLITVVNKTVLTSYSFPSYQVLALGQMTTTVVVLFCAKRLGIVSFPAFDSSVVRKVWPLPVIYIGNVVFGLGGTKELSLPMLTVLRRFSILMTMLGEYWILGVRPGFAVQLSVYTMIAGAIVAASNDLAFNLNGYVLVILNDIFTATNGVIMKQKLDSAELGNNGVLFYNSLLMLPPGVIVAWLCGEWQLAAQFPHWDQSLFIFEFGLSCVMGFILTYSIMLCTLYNSALTTTVVGCLKNISITYMGMIIAGDYIFSIVNFIGINISVLGSLAYTWVTFTRKKTKTLKTPIPTSV